LESGKFGALIHLDRPVIFDQMGQFLFKIEALEWSRHLGDLSLGMEAFVLQFYALWQLNVGVWMIGGWLTANNLDLLSVFLWWGIWVCEKIELNDGSLKLNSTIDLLGK
jgi:hypothetical protein